MDILHSPGLPNLLYLGLVAGFWLVAMAVLVPGTGALELLAFAALVLAGLGTFVVPVNEWALIPILAAMAFFVLSLRQRQTTLWLVLSAVALSLGSAFLYGETSGAPAVHPLLAVLISVLTLGYFWLIVRKALMAHAARPAFDPLAVVGAVGEARTDLDPTGSVYVGGELWTAQADHAIAAGSRVRVQRKDGLTLIVDDETSSPGAAPGQGG
jgi:membrane-bound serine protease (ClpP class)